MAYPVVFSLPFAGKWRRLRSSKTLTLITVCVAMFTDGFIYGVVTPIIPFLLEDKHLVAKDKLITYTSLLLAAFSLSDFITGPLCAIYVDNGGSRMTAWCIGILLLTAGTALFCATPHHYLLLLFSQILHGASSAILYTLSFAMLVDKVEAHEVGTYVGTMMSFCNLGIVLSPVVGGLLYGTPGIYSIAAIMFAFGFVNLGFRILVKTSESTLALSGVDPTICESVRKRTDSGVDVEEKDDRGLPTYIHDDIDFPNIMVVPSPINSNSSRTTRIQSIFENRLSSFKHLLTSKRLASALYSIFVAEFIVAALLCSIFAYAKDLFGWNARDTSFLSFCIAIPSIAGPVFGWLSDRFGARKVTIASAIVGYGTLFQLSVIDHDDLTQKVLLCVLLSLSALALTGIMTPLSAEFAHVAAEITSEAGGCTMVASSFSLLNCAVALAGGLGPIIGGTVMEAMGWKAMTLLLGIVCVSAVVPCGLFTGNKGIRVALKPNSTV